MDFEAGTMYDVNKPAPEMWSFPTNLEHCCLYRVTHSIRRGNEEAYSPKLLIIGHLHHLLKAQARGHGDIRLGFIQSHRL